MLLIIDKKGSILRYQNRTIRIEQEGKKPRNIPINQLDQVIIYGNPMVDASVFRALAQAGVPATLLASRGRMADAVLGPGLATQLPFRQQQHQLASLPEASLALARYTVQLKLQSYTLPLKTLKRLYNAEGDSTEAFSTQLKQIAEKLTTCTQVNCIMGLEGQAAKAWFALLATHLPSHWKFAGRNRQPPQDPVNALLSLGYTLTFSDIRQAAVSHGLDPALGYLHQNYPGRESMVLDMIEIFRAAVDHFVLHLLATKRLDQHSFYYRDKEGCRLSKSARPAFYKAWANYRYHWPRPFKDEIGDTDASDETDWPIASIQEITSGQIMRLRGVMKQLGIQYSLQDRSLT